MNHDETSSNSNPTHPIEPELEARVVAWVLGEASPFEAAELERRCAAEPELAEFKRRMLAVHGLVREAARPLGAAGAVWRLAPERRAKVLAVIGEVETPTADAGAAVKAAVFRAEKERSGGSGGWRTWVMPLAACVTILGLLAAMAIPSFQKVRSSAPHAVAYESVASEAAYLRVPQAETLGDDVGGARPAVESRVASSWRADVASDSSSYALMSAPASAPAAPAAPPPPATSVPVAAAAARKRADQPVDDAGGGSPAAFVVREAMPDQELTFGSATGTGVEVASYDKRRAGGGAEPRMQRQLSERPAVELKLAATADADFSEKNERVAVFFDAPPSIALGGTVINGAGEKEGAAKRDSWLEADRVGQEPVLVTGLEVLAKSEPSGKLARLNEELKDLPAERPALVASAFDETLRAEVAAADEAVSTFSLHVGDASFRLAKAALERGAAPDPATIRPEEFYNAFDYGDPAPAAGEPVACRVEQATHPFMQQRNLVRIALRVPAAGRGAGTPLNLTVLLDTSGSMEREDRAATVRAALGSLAALLGANDRVTLVGFARQPRLLVEGLAGDQAGQLAELAASTPAEGGTNLEEALKLAGELARRQWRAGAQNRIVLLTDGAANLGDADPARLATQVEALRRQGVAFDACGVGADGLDDGVLEALTRKGDGRYQVLNSPEEADAGFARKLAGAFRPAAENVKVQVRFNPERVARYRLVGFEKHRLREEDFRDDKVDAAELAAEEAAVALYQVEVIPGEERGELGDVAVRFRDTAGGQMVERTWTLTYEAQPAAFDRALASLRLAGAAALLAEKLRGGAQAGQIRLDELAPVVAGLRGAYAGDARVADFLRMFDQTRRLTGE